MRTHLILDSDKISDCGSAYEKRSSQIWFSDYSPVVRTVTSELKGGLYERDYSDRRRSKQNCWHPT